MPLRLSNCLFWALCARWRLGGRIIWRWGYNGPYPHFGWTDGRHILDFSRDDDYPTVLLVFAGSMEWGDPGLALKLRGQSELTKV